MSNSTTPVLYAFVDQSVKVTSCVDFKKWAFEKSEKVMNDLTPHADCRDPYCGICVCETCHVVLLFCNCRQQ